LLNAKGGSITSWFVAELPRASYLSKLASKPIDLHLPKKDPARFQQMAVHELPEAAGSMAVIDRVFAALDQT